MKMKITGLLAFGFSMSAHGLTIAPKQYSTPGIYGDTLMFSQRTGSKLYAVDRETKRDVWVWSSHGRRVRTRPTVVDGVAYIWAGDCMTNSRACAVDCKSGKSLWEIPDKGWAFLSAIIAEDVVLFPVEAYHYEIHAFDRKGGKPLWVRTDCKMMLAHGKSVLATTADDTRVALLDIRSGETLFETPLVDEKSTEPQADCNVDGEAVIGCQGMLLKLSIPGRKLLWRKSTPKEKWIPTIHDDDLYLLSGYPPAPEARQGLQVRSLRNGSVQRELDVKAGAFTYSPAYVFERIIVVSTGGVLLGFDRKTFEEKWRLETGKVYQTSRDESSVYVGGVGPYLWRVDAITGKKTWTYENRSQQDKSSVRGEARR